MNSRFSKVAYGIGNLGQALREKLDARHGE